MMYAKRLKELREEKGLTQEALGELVGLTKANISKYESGKLEPNIDTINYLANYFNVSTDYLLGRTDNRTTGMEKNNGEIMGDPQIRALARASRNLSPEKKELLKRIAESMIEEAIKDEENDKQN